MNKLRGSIVTTVGAVALTVVAAGAALAVNAGILRNAPDTGVGNLESEATTVPAVAQDPNVRYIDVFVTDPPATRDPAVVAPTSAGAPATISSDPALTDPASSVDDGTQSGEVEDDDHDEYEDHDESEDHGSASDHEDEHEDDHGEYEGADDDD